MFSRISSHVYYDFLLDRKVTKYENTNRTYLFRVFLRLTGPLLNAQSTLIICERRSVPSDSFIASWASSKFSYSIRAYPCTGEVKPNRHEHV
jgi:hypothetical protein